MKAHDHHKIVQILTRAHMVATQVLEHFHPVREDGTACTGGYLVVADGQIGLPLGSLFIGEVPDDKDARYIKLAQEKALRLAANMSVRGHVLSWQSRDPERDLWGGAAYIGMGNVILSFSGFPEELDEAIDLVTASIGLNVPATSLVSLAEISSNRAFFRLMKLNGVYLTHPLAA